MAIPNAVAPICGIIARHFGMAFYEHPFVT